MVRYFLWHAGLGGNFVLYTFNANNQVITQDKFLLQLSIALISFIITRLATTTIIS